MPLVVAFGCGGHTITSGNLAGASGSAAGGAAACVAGEERCDCYPNDTCNDALRCLSGLCVNDSGGSVGGSRTNGAEAGAAGSIAAGSSGAASAISTAGASGKAGSSSQGGVAGSGDVGSNLIANGDFSDAHSDWGLVGLGTSSTSEVPIVDGALCVTLRPAAEFGILGWPQDLSKAAHLFAGKTYTLSYDVRGTGPAAVSVNAKVGHAALPFTEDFSSTDVVGTDNLLQTFTHSETLVMGDNQAGVALQLTLLGIPGSSTVCFDNISLTEAN